MKTAKRKRAAPRLAEQPDEQEIKRAKISGGHVSQSLSRNIKEKYGLPLAFLTDKQWVNVKEISGLVHSARFEVNIALRRYWHNRLLAVDPATIERVLQAREALDAAVDALIPLMGEEADLYNGRVVHFEQSAAEQHLRLERCVHTLSRTEQMLSRIQHRLERSKKPGNPGYGPLYELVHHLDFILYSFLGVNVTRSPNRMTPLGSGSSLDFVTAIVQIADLKVTKSTVDTIVRNYVKDRRRQGSDFASYPGV